MLTAIQCDPTLPNQSPNLNRGKTNQMTRSTLRKPRSILSTSSAIITYLTLMTTTDQTTQATRPTVRRSDKSNNPSLRQGQHQRQKTTKRARKERSRRLHVRSSPGRMQTIRGSRSRAKEEMAVKAALVGSDRRTGEWFLEMGCTFGPRIGSSAPCCSRSSALLTKWWLTYVYCTRVNGKSAPKIVAFETQM